MFSKILLYVGDTLSLQPRARMTSTFSPDSCRQAYRHRRVRKAMRAAVHADALKQAVRHTSHLLAVTVYEYGYSSITAVSSRR